MDGHVSGSSESLARLDVRARFCASGVLAAAAVLAGAVVACERVQPEPETVELDESGSVGPAMTVGPFEFGGRSFTILLDTLETHGEIAIVRMRAVAEDGAVHLDMPFDTPSVGPNGFESRVEIHANRLIGERDTALIVWFEHLPSAPLTGSSMQVFALAEERLRPLWPPLTLHGELRPLEGDGRDSRLAPGDIYPVMIWRDYYGIVVPLVLELDCARDGGECVRLPLGAAGPAAYVVEVEARAPDEATTITLYDTPHGAPLAERVVTPASEIRIVEAAAGISIQEDEGRTVIDVADDWLHVTIDGVSGWIFGGETFAAIGLRLAG